MKLTKALLVAASIAIIANEAQAAGWINTKCVAFLMDGRQVAVVKPQTNDHCIRTAKKCTASLNVRQFSFFTNGTAVASNGVNLVCTMS